VLETKLILSKRDLIVMMPFVMNINVDCRLVPLFGAVERWCIVFRPNLQRIIVIAKKIIGVSSDDSGILEASVKDESNKKSAQSIALLSTGLVQTPINATVILPPWYPE
jgi:hypothetical protein